MSSEGERYIREYISDEPLSGMETSLTSGYCKSVRDREGRLIERFDGEFYFFGSSPPDQHTDMCGSTFSVAPSPCTVGQLRSCVACGLRSFSPTRLRA